MNSSGLVLSSLRHYWRTHLGTVAGLAIATATLVGALVVGDSVRHSLRSQAAARVGQVGSALSSGDRFFLDALPERMVAAGAADAPTPAALVLLPGVAASSDGARRVHDVFVHGVDAAFFGLRPTGGARPAPSVPEAGKAHVNAALGRALELAPGDTLVVRVARPSALPRDVALAQDDITVALRLEVERVLTPGDFGAFALLGSSSAQPNLFLPRGWLQERLEIEGRANLLLSAQADAPALDAALRAAWTPEDAQLELLALPAPDAARHELRTSRVFFDAPVLEALAARDELALEGVFTYFVDALRAGDRATPYSMVAGIGAYPAQAGAVPATLFGRSLQPGEALVNDWLADDLGVGPGDVLTLEYTAIDASRKLVAAERTVTVAGVVPLDGPAGDRTLMPDFPGLADAENCRDWEPGTPVELERIRDEDEAYWDDHAGTPKAFLTLGDARELWSNRFGELTALRFDAGQRGAVEAALREGLDPAALGLFFQDVAGRAAAAGDSPTDFGGLFVGLSSFLILAALLLAGQLFAFGVQQRAREAGLLSAVGFEGARVRGLFLREALALAVLGAALGTGLGVLYTRAVLAGLAGVWRDAVAGTEIGFHAEPRTLWIGALASVAVGLATAWLVLRRELRRPTQQLLTASSAVEDRADADAAAGRGALLLPLVLGVLALALVLLVDPASGPSAAGAFFGAGALALAALLLACRLWLRRAGRTRRAPVQSLGGLGVAGTWRRPGRSLALVGLTAIPTFLVVAIGANRLGPVADETARESGTGGFLFYGRTSLPIVQDLNDAVGREAYLLDDPLLDPVRFVPLRVRAGDDASCLNLARPSAPRLLGVAPEDLASRGAFPFASAQDVPGGASPWTLLERSIEDEDGLRVVPAIGDATSLTWQLKKGLGDRIDYVDERGRAFRVEIVATIANTILQGDLLVAESAFQSLYPTEGGHRLVLVDAPLDEADEIAAQLTRGLEDLGLALERSGERLAAFHAVQNTYLNVFQLLGALGLLLGSVGLGVVLLRNTQERRAELALAGALGFRPGRVRWWVTAEYGTLLLLGLGVGLVASLVAVGPAMRAPGSDLSLVTLFALGALVGAAGIFWIALAARVAVQRAPLDALRAE